MTISKKIIHLLPELYLILAVLYYWSLTSSVINPVALVLLGILIVLIVTKKQILGIVIASIIILLNINMILALLSELSEFPEFNDKAQQLALVGFLFIGINISVASFMLVKYITNKKNEQKEK